MQLPCICFYGLKTDAFPPPQNEGRNRISTYIDAKYFRDFADNASPAEIAALPPKKQPAIAVIKDWAEFVRRLKAKLNSIGVPDECILVSPVQYFDFSPYSTDDSWVDLNCTPPKELFVKSKQDFEYQNELRIVIDTDDPTILDLLSNPTNKVFIHFRYINGKVHLIFGLVFSISSQTHQVCTTALAFQHIADSFFVQFTLCQHTNN